MATVKSGGSVRAGQGVDVQAIIEQMKQRGFTWEYPGFFAYDVHGLTFTVGIDDPEVPFICQAQTNDGEDLEIEFGDCATIDEVMKCLAAFKEAHPGPTPGPWEAEAKADESNALVYGRGRKRGQRKQMVAQVWSGDDRSLEVAKANAALIAAAPDLLAAARAARKLVAHGRTSSDEDEVLEILDNAIEKAERRTA